MNLRRFPPQNKRSVSNLMFSFSEGKFAKTPKLVPLPIEKGKSKELYCGYSKIVDKRITKGLKVTPIWLDYKGSKIEEDLDSDES